MRVKNSVLIKASNSLIDDYSPECVVLSCLVSCVLSSQKPSIDDLMTVLSFLSLSGVWSFWVPVTQRWCCRWFLNCSAHTRTSTHRSPTWTIRPVSFTHLKTSKHTCVNVDEPHLLHSAQFTSQIWIFSRWQCVKMLKCLQLPHSVFTGCSLPLISDSHRSVCRLLLWNCELYIYLSWLRLLISDIAVLVLVFNAAKSCPTMPALFSDHTFRHYAYLRDSLSHLVPPLRVRPEIL